MMRRFFTLLLIPLLSACAAAVPAAAPTPTPMVFQPTLGRGLSFLARQVDAAPGLLHASPTQPDVHWLAPDNLLVEWVLQEANAERLSVTIDTTLHEYGVTGNGLLEVLHGASIDWPPGSPVQVEVAPTAWLESYTGDEVLSDWESDARLSLLGAVNASNQGDAAQAAARYAAALALFDGTGFAGSTATEQYATADLAVALLAGERLDEPVNDAIVRRLLALQTDDGGFAAHYTAAGPADGADTVTTAYALLALYALRQPIQ
ncbi:MAG: hypothetical protein KDD75_23310 [Caldilineaceae bacterium]|nr:hypothetical protein [Caldilineaceae bacterium]HRW50292.1 hypothetical protein [Caldilinea sp.]